MSSPGDRAGAKADAAVTATPGCALVVRTADCAPIALLADASVGIVHAGWRGLLDGVVEQAVDALRDLGAHTIQARIGPCISPAHYEFGAAELDRVAAWYGGAVRGVTADGAPALDLVAGVRAALATAGVEVVDDHPPACTAAEPDRYFSFRARAETGRQASFAWLDP